MRLEGSTVAVSNSVVLPLQPSTGDVRYIPLGGDGFSAPVAAYNVIGLGVTGATGGGSASLTVTFDDRYAALLSYVSVANVQVASADADISIVLTAGSLGMPTQALQENVTAISAVVNAGTIRRTWSPTPVMLAGAEKRGVLSFTMVNVENDAYTLSCLIYLFNIRVREMTPMGPLLWARGAT